MDEDIEIGGFSMKGKRRMSEDLAEAIDHEEVKQSIHLFMDRSVLVESE